MSEHFRHDRGDATTIDSSFDDRGTRFVATPENPKRTVSLRGAAWAAAFTLAAGIGLGAEVRSHEDNRSKSATALQAEATKNTAVSVALMLGRMNVAAVAPADIHVAPGADSVYVSLPGNGSFGGGKATCTINFPVVMHNFQPVGLEASQTFNNTSQQGTISTHSDLLKAEQNHCPTPSTPPTTN